MKADGSPVRFSQTLDGGKGTVRGQANNVAYSSAGSTVVLTGNAKVQRGGDVAEGAVITYNTKNRSLYHQRQHKIRRKIRFQIRQGQRHYPAFETQNPNNPKMPSET